MRIGLQTWGSAGDVRPMIGLAQGLHLAGHAVTLAVSRVDANDETPNDYPALAPQIGFEMRRVGNLRYTSIAEARELFLRILKTRNPIMQIERMMAWLFDPMAEAIIEGARDLCRDNDVVVGNSLGFPLAVESAKSKRPFVTVTYLPNMIPSALVPPHGLPNLGPWLNPLAWALMIKAVGRVFMPRVNALRKREGLAPVKDFIQEVASSPLLDLVAASPALCRPMPDWASHHQVCGFLDVPTRDDDYALPEDLERFLRAGPAPVFMTFGSMLFGDAEFERVVRILVDATQRAGCRAIIQASWDEIRTIPESSDVYRLIQAPHARIFPRCAAVVHHGGSGTSHSATLAGCPSIVVTYAYDQDYWAQCLRRAGMASAPLRRASLRAEDLASKIRQTLEAPGLKARAEALGQRLRDERGVDRAVTFIEQAFEASQTASAGGPREVERPGTSRKCCLLSPTPSA